MSHDVKSPMGLFQAVGVELEYMIVRKDTLEVLPVADEVLRQAAGSYESEVERDGIAWSNELVLHVIELKTNGPAPGLDGLTAKFTANVQEINRRLDAMDAVLLPGGAHPWMDPHRETRLWPHGDAEIYQAFNRIFDCRGHGWSNLQSAHLNLPFSGSEEFGRLHAAIRLVLPLIPALAASSPLLDGRPTGLLDTRLEYYRKNCRRIPSVSGRVIPEGIFTPEAYQSELLQPIYNDLAPLDPQGILQYEWVNARGAIARFDRNTIEIRVIDVQECPQADLAIAALVVATIKALCEERWCTLADQQSATVEALERPMRAAMREGSAARAPDSRLTEMLGRGAPPGTLGETWHSLAEELIPASSEHWPALRTILDQGSLAERILRRTGSHPDRPALTGIYRELSGCLAEGALFS